MLRPLIRVLAVFGVRLLQPQPKQSPLGKMGEVAALSAAFDTEVAKNLAALPSIHQCPPSEHDAHLNHHRAAQRIVQEVQYYASKLPFHASLHRILALGDRLQKQGEYQLALDACYLHVKRLSLHLQRDVPRLNDATCLAYHVQACYGAGNCEAALALQRDPNMVAPGTLSALVACQAQLKEGLAMVLPSEQLYWLTLNGTVFIYNLSKKLLAAGYVAQMLPFLLFCVKALEQHVIFSTAKYLPWRTQLYIALCYAYCDLQAYDLARYVLGIDRKHVCACSVPVPCLCTWVHPWGQAVAQSVCAFSVPYSLAAMRAGTWCLRAWTRLQRSSSCRSWTQCLQPQRCRPPTSQARQSSQPSSLR